MGLILPPNTWRQQPSDVPLISPVELQLGLKEVILPHLSRSLIGQVSRTVTGTVLDDVTVGGRGRKIGDNASARDLFAGAWSRTAQFTVVVVGRLNSIPGSTRRLCGNFTSVTSGFTFSPTASNHRLILSSSSANFTITDSASIAIGEFILVGRYNGTQGHLFSNGKSTGTPVTLTYATGSTDFRIGNDSGVNATPATVQAFAYYDRALSDHEIYEKFRNKESFYSSIFVSQEPITVLSSVAAGSHATSGDLVGSGAVITGTVTQFRAHDASGNLVGSGAAITGTAVQFRAHATSGDLVGPGAVITASAEQSSAGSHDVTGDLIGSGAVITGTATQYTLHQTSGDLVGSGATITGTVSHIVLHDTSGNLIGAGAVITATASGTGATTLTAADLAAIAEAVWNHSKALTVVKFLSLK